MKKNREVHINVEYTEGYQERFTMGILKIYYNRIRKEMENSNKHIEEVYNSPLEHQQV